MEEKMMILKMLQEGKISAEEACRLLEAIESKKGNQGESKFSYADNDHFNRKMNKAFEKLNKDSEKFSGNYEKYTNDFAKRMEIIGTDIAESAVKFADKLVNYFGNVFDNNIDKFLFTKNYSYPCEDIKGIKFDTSNFAIKVIPSDVQNIILNIHANSINQKLIIDENFKAEVFEKTYTFTTDFPDKTWGKIELFIPKSITDININTNNGKCEIYNIVGESIKCHTSNGKLCFFECTSKELEAVTNNGKIIMENVLANTAYISTSNGKIEFSKCKFNNIDAKTSNGSIQVEGIYKLDAKEAYYNLYTSNGKIDIELNSTDSCGYLIDASTSLGGINISLPELEYSVDKKVHTMQSNALVKSTNFDALQDRIIIKANTSNASIIIEAEN